MKEAKERERARETGWRQTNLLASLGIDCHSIAGGDAQDVGHALGDAQDAAVGLCISGPDIRPRRGIAVIICDGGNGAALAAGAKARRIGALAGPQPQHVEGDMQLWMVADDQRPPAVQGVADGDRFVLSVARVGRCALQQLLHRR